LQPNSGRYIVAQHKQKCEGFSSPFRNAKPAARRVLQQKKTVVKKSSGSSRAGRPSGARDGPAALKNGVHGTGWKLPSPGARPAGAAKHETHASRAARPQSAGIERPR
jgi:hypothetical protein